MPTHGFLMSVWCMRQALFLSAHTLFATFLTMWLQNGALELQVSKLKQIGHHFYFVAKKGLVVFSPWFLVWPLSTQSSRFHPCVPRMQISIIRCAAAPAALLVVVIWKDPFLLKRLRTTSGIHSCGAFQVGVLQRPDEHRCPARAFAKKKGLQNPACMCLFYQKPALYNSQVLHTGSSRRPGIYFAK